MKTTNQKGFAAIEAVSIVVILAIIGFTGWYVWHSKQSANRTLSETDNSAVQKPAAKITSFAECEKTPGSHTLMVSPEVCVTKDGKSFTEPSAQKYLTIKEWGVKIPLSQTDTGSYYKVDTDIQQSATNPTNLTVYSTETDQLAGPAGVSCKGEYVAYLLRLPKDDSSWQPSENVDDGNVSPVFIERKVIGQYKYAVATHKQYGPACWETSKTGNYNPDPATSQVFENVVNAFVANFKDIQAE